MGAVRRRGIRAPVATPTISGFNQRGKRPSVKGAHDIITAIADRAGLDADVGTTTSTSTPT